MGCTRCFVDHPAGASCTLPETSPCEGEVLPDGYYGPLRLVRRLGSGTLGTVYLAEHPSTGTPFAVKVLHPALSRNEALRRCLYAEVRAARHVVHPNVARVLDVRPVPGGHPCVLMEYASGTPLSRLPMPLPPEEAVALLRDALEGLRAAHAHGVLHRDLKPEDLLLSDEGKDAGKGRRRVRILGLGMAGALAASLSARELAAGRVAGTPAYLAPEQWVGAEPDARTDLYALAVVAYRLLTGRLPFGGGGRRGEMLLGRPESVLLPPHALNPRVPAPLSAVVVQALSRHPDERFASARAFAAALHHALRRPTTPRPSLARLGVRLEDLERPGLHRADVGDVSEEGFFVLTQGPLPPPGARLQVEISLDGQAVSAACDVVRLVSPEEARAAGASPGYLAGFSEGSEDARRVVRHALEATREPEEDELSRLRARAASCGDDLYLLLGLAPSADFSEVLQRAVTLERQLSTCLARPLASERREALESLLARVRAARLTLGDPVTRAAFDAARGNVGGVARCLAAGVSSADLARLRHDFLDVHPEAGARARALFDEAVLLEAQALREAALSRYAKALALDPLNPALHRYHQALLRRMCAVVAAVCGPHAAEAR